MSKVKKAVIPAAGLGTRFLPVTKALAKEMLLIVDKSTIARAESGWEFVAGSLQQ